MAMTPEAKVKKKVVEQLKALNAYYFFPATGGYGKSGVPDIVGCYKGKFFGIECKAGKEYTNSFTRDEPEADSRGARVSVRSQ